MRIYAQITDKVLIFFRHFDLIRSRSPNGACRHSKNTPSPDVFPLKHAHSMTSRHKIIWFAQSMPPFVQDDFMPLLTGQMSISFE
ncbi:hypothetical protein [Xenorhabdus griffiniae]|uniref:Uncharacterized protein n=1 Tax=Xenorhabdus griffiniae TaxID=351672 RepID=A0ABY9XNP2_9GAMM|nr:hypothetical protein [Xenorhabdus griffiniae]MBD1229013.1 hypothetical protein [Xenorhabdus griffiniae]MBE8588752.1 hypothetical protein [Xenorhabdus griffiniae]WMV74574.1 hypothetical protein QL128_18655 [Xenorhabdus griffiniae]WNH04253.1 hypothetical protein QL112_018665 [Xenorhabdus griffiniae]